MPPASQLADSFLRSGKVRDLYAVSEDRLLLVASDRLSAFDVVLPTPIPDKGRVLTGLSAYWFAQTRSLVPNHLLALRDDGRSTECKRLEMLPIECVVRGYLSGSGWKDYCATGAVCGHELPSGLQESDRLPEPIFTPSTKAITGHDENIDRNAALDLVDVAHFEALCHQLLTVAVVASLSGRAAADRVAELAIALYRRGAEIAEPAGVILADTKFEFGIDPATRELLLIDEVMTPDSSRFWDAADYEPGRAQASFDKQFVRDWLETQAWDKTPPGPELPPEVVAGTRSRYVEAFERITGASFQRYLDDDTIGAGA